MKCKKVHTFQKKVSNSATNSFNIVQKSSQIQIWKVSVHHLKDLKNILYQSEDVTRQTFQTPLIRYHSSSPLGTQFQRYETSQTDGGDDLRVHLLALWYEERKLVHENWLYSVGVGYLGAICQKPGGEKMGQWQQFHNCNIKIQLWVQESTQCSKLKIYWLGSLHIFQLK